MKIIKSPPPLTKTNFSCNNCKSEYEVTNDDVVYVCFREGVTIKSLTPKWYEDFREISANAYQYTVKCQTCGAKNYLHDHFGPQREGGGSYNL